MNRRIHTFAALAATTVLLGPGAVIASASEKVDPIEEFALHRIGPEMKIGPIDMSINKAVIYLWIAAAICCIWTYVISRRMTVKPSSRQTFTEVVYEFAHDSIARATLGEKMFARYMPLVACLFMFLWVLNIISFFPLPLGHEKMIFGIPAFTLYAAASNINVTLALALVVFLLTHYEGVRNNGPIGYLKSWAPSGIDGFKRFILVPVIWCLHALSEMLRLVSLSVRLFANMLAGHLLILMMLSLIIIIGSALVAIGSVPIALFFYMFEFGLVASLQAFIFAMLTGIYLGTAADPHH